MRNDIGKIQRAEKISEMNLGAGNTENAIEMACAFNKLFLLTVIVDTLIPVWLWDFSDFIRAGG
jgi:hypothetical protein